MASDSSSNMLADWAADWAADLACPVCHRGLRIDQPRIVCTGCGRVYPVIDGIPVLIADRADVPDPE